MINQELSIDLLLGRRQEFEIIRAKADGAIQAIDIIIMDLQERTKHEQEIKEQEAQVDPTGCGPSRADSGNGNADSPAAEGNGSIPSPAVRTDTSA